MARSDHWTREKAAASINPAQVETALIHLSEHWPETAQSLIDVVEQFPLGEAALIHLLAVSSICAARLTHDPDSLRGFASRKSAVRLAGMRRCWATCIGRLATRSQTRVFRPFVFGRA